MVVAATAGKVAAATAEVETVVVATAVVATGSVVVAGLVVEVMGRANTAATRFDYRQLYRSRLSTQVR